MFQEFFFAQYLPHFFFVRVPFQMAKELRTWINESMEKEEKRRLADEAREKRALAIANAPRRRSGRLIVSFCVFVFSCFRFLFFICAGRFLYIK